MHKLKVYLDTSVINFLLAEDAPDYRKDTERFFAEVVAVNKIDTYISGVVTEELNNTQDIEKKKRLLAVLTKYPGINKLEATDETASDINLLAEAYIKNNIIPRSKVADALHIAYTTVYEMDILLSWNFKHLANVRKERDIMTINKINGFNYPFRMTTPLEVLSNE
ncbi:putative PIN domain protein [Candidatus Termititenax persephonae]|uniref:PIN domain protein n=1 Tax=Candidatus Termititenax persephonae TaxID=2218525 RepID=A0A388TI23_9BACT|nr:putative PIN domain protein [Candidatus Termititenax persephonae]